MMKKIYLTPVTTVTRIATARLVAVSINIYDGDDKVVTDPEDVWIRGEIWPGLMNREEWGASER